jgi:hypothetical protein
VVRARKRVITAVGQRKWRRDMSHLSKKNRLLNAANCLKLFSIILGFPAILVGLYYLIGGLTGLSMGEEGFSFVFRGFLLAAGGVFVITLGFTISVMAITLARNEEDE